MKQISGHSSAENHLVVKPYSITELSHQYQISIHTMRKWIKRYEKQVGERVGRCYSVKQVATLYDCLGTPPDE